MKLLLLASLAAASAIAAPSYTVFAYSTASDATSLTIDTTDGTFFLDALDRGWYDSFGLTNGASPNNNFIAGICGSSDECNGDDVDRRNWFRFDLSGVTGMVLDAFLTLRVPSPDGYIGPTPTVPYFVYDVEGDFDELGTVDSLLTYVDLGTGPLFGSVVTTDADEGSDVFVFLNAAALAAIQSNLGGNFAVGGSVDTSLIVPEPATVGLAAGALLGLAALRKRYGR